jgi:peptidoglycan hydrolase-like protein with peptidoglycan-binding domain
MGHGSSASNSGATRTAAATTAPAVSNDMVRQVQSRLQHDGYYKTGNVDGIWGSGTESAVMAFQRDHNISASGRLDAPTLQAMNIVGANAPNATTDVPPDTTTRSDVTPPPANWDTRPPGTTTPYNAGR